MSIIKDLIGDARRIRNDGKMLREEDDIRSLALGERYGFRLPLVYGNNDYLLTKDSAWAGFWIPNKPWGFLDQSSRTNYFLAANAIFERIFPAGKENSGHLLVTNHVYSADEWEEALLERYGGRTERPNFARYVHFSRKAIERNEFFERECYLFTRMGTRGNRGGIRGTFRSVIEMFAIGAGLDDSQPDVREKDFWTEQASNTVETLGSSWLTAEPIHRRRVEWLIRHLDTPGLPTPDHAPADEQEWGIGAWRTTLASYTEEVDLGVAEKNRFKCVKFDAPVGNGVTYAAYLPLNHIPNQMVGLQNWIHHAASLQFPVDVSLHFEVVDPERAEKDLQSLVTAAEAQEEEDREAGAKPDDTTMIQQDAARSVKTEVRMNRKPLAYWQAVFAVYDNDKDALLKKVTRLIRHYKDIHFDLCCPNRDQRELFYQSMPGSEILVEDWIHRTETGYLAAAMPWLTTSVGDRDARYGLYQGHTIVNDTNGSAQVGVPVFYDLQNVVDEEGKAPTEVVCGFPGSGKSVSRGLKCAHEDSLRGITQFVWDPKGDFLPLKQWAKQMQLDPNKVKLVDLYDSSNSVSLDAFSIAEVDPERNIDEREASALDVLWWLCRDFVQDKNNNLQYQQILRRAVQVVMMQAEQQHDQPTMLAVLDVLRTWRQGDFAATEVSQSKQEMWADLSGMLDDHLTSVQANTLGKLLFRDPRSAGSMKIVPGDLVIFVALKMRTTEPGEEPNTTTAIADVVSGLMTDFIRSILYTLPDEEPKSVIFDEWHVIKRTKRAEGLVDWMRRMGRSKRCMVRQMSQSATDFTKGSLSTVWCGYAQNHEEAVASCQLLGIEPSDPNTALLQNLKPGQFLFKDVLGRVARVQVDIWDSWLLEKFNTQAKAKAEIAKQLAQQKELAPASHPDAADPDAPSEARTTTQQAPAPDIEQE